MIIVGLYGTKDVALSERGRKFIVHDHNLSILKDGNLKYFIQLERFTNIKHDNRLEEYIDLLIKKYALNLVEKGEEITFISVNSFLGNSFESNSGKLRIEPISEVSVEKIISESFGMLFDVEEKLGEDSNLLSLILPTIPASFYIMTHEFAHIATNLPFYGRFKENSLLVHIDGGAYKSNSSVWYFDGERIKLIDYSWNKLKDVVNNFNANLLTFYILNDPHNTHLSIPGKLMGYSGYGEVDEGIREWLRKNRYFLDFEGDKNELLDIINKRFSSNLKSFDMKDRLIMNIAATIQDEFKRKVVDFIEHYKDLLGADYLYYAGGAALNIKTNSVLEDKLGFKQVYIPPPCNDSGLSLGAAYGYLWMENRDFELITPYINNIYPEDINPIRNKLEKHAYETYSDSQEVMKTMCEMLHNFKVLGIYMGHGEAGPRALGHRSIIARPDDIDLRVRVSEKIKQREWYRPVAPIILDYLAEKVLLEKEHVRSSFLGEYMLREYSIKPEYTRYFKGVIHADGSVRAQILFKEKETEFLYDVMDCMFKKYEIYGLINTSFNRRGKPIVQGEETALLEAERMGLDGVYINGRLHIF